MGSLFIFKLLPQREKYVSPVHYRDMKMKNSNKSLPRRQEINDKFSNTVVSRWATLDHHRYLCQLYIKLLSLIGNLTALENLCPPTARS